MTLLLSTLLLTPFVGALAIVAVKSQHVRAIRLIAAAAQLAAVVLVIPVWFGYDPAATTWQFTERVDWIPGRGVSYSLGVDGFSIVLIAVTTFVGLLATVLPWRDDRGRAKRYHLAILVLQASVVGVFLALDLLLFFVFWNIALGATGFLISRLGEVEPALSSPKGSATNAFSIYMVGGSLALLTGILILCFHAHAVTGVYTFDMVRLLDLTIARDVQRLAFVPLFLAFTVVAAVFPLHGWLPAAVEGLPAGGVLMVTAALLTLGTYGLIRLSLPLLPDATRDFAAAGTVLAVAGVLFGAMAAFRQTTWIRVVAYASGACMAATMVSLFRLTPAGLTVSILQQIDHAIVLVALFLAAGVLSGRRTPKVVLAFVVVAMSLLSGWAIVTARSVNPGYFVRQIETSVGRVIARVNPAYAPVVKQPSDCGKPASKVEPSSAAPAGWVTTAPCEDATTSSPDRKK